MPRTSGKAAGKKPPASEPCAGFSDPAVAAIPRWPRSSAPIRRRCGQNYWRCAGRNTARTTEGVGALKETLKWGQPGYLTTATKSGSTIRIDRVKEVPHQVAIYFHCQTDLVATFRELYSTELSYGGNRSILLHAKDAVPQAALRHCVGLALTYHLRKRK